MGRADRQFPPAPIKGVLCEYRHFYGGADLQLLSWSQEQPNVGRSGSFEREPAIFLLGFRSVYRRQPIAAPIFVRVLGSVIVLRNLRAGGIFWLRAMEPQEGVEIVA